MNDLKGQITIFTIVGCPHCLHAKQLLKGRGLKYVEVSVDKNPAIRDWLKAKINKISVPQIFFNDISIGGNDILQEVSKNDEKWQELLELLKEPLPPNSLPISSDLSELTNNGELEIPESRIHDPQTDIIKAFSDSEIPRNFRNGILSKKLRNVFSGEDFISWYMEGTNGDVYEALDVGRELLQKAYIVPVHSATSPTKFSKENDTYYRLNESCNEKHVYNTGPRKDFVDHRDADAIARNIRNMILNIYTKYISEDGRLVDYAGIARSEEFTKFVEFTRVLQTISAVSVTEKKSFFINIYNALVVHANAVNGPPSSYAGRALFFANTSYIIGGYKFSLNDIENGILRANRRPLLSFSVPFQKEDPRIRFALDKVDPRIHFALNCGAQSCPPIKTFSAENIEEELRLATEAYLESEGLQIKERENGLYEVHLSKLMSWYKEDFTDQKDDRYLVEWVKDNVGNDIVKTKLEKILEGSFKIQFLSYNWSSNAKL